MKPIYAVHIWIVVLANAYMEYVTVGEKSVLSRTVGYEAVVWC
jgi:hypothetical protein